jgi:mono/diheme cytochrome c family protein
MKLASRTIMKNRIVKSATASALGLIAATSMAADNRALEQVEQQWQLFDSYCVNCHNFEDWAGSLAFDTLSPNMIPNNRDVFEKAIRKMRGRLMPPPGNEKPSEADLKNFIATLENYLDSLVSDTGPNPGHVSVHRLNRDEYERAIEDLLAFEIDAEELLPPDATSDGFTNVAEVLQVSPTFLEQYIQAARNISIAAVTTHTPEPDLASFIPPSLANQYRHVKGLPLGTRGGFLVDHYFPADGDYTFTIELGSQEGSLQRSYPTWWLEDEHTFILTVDGEEVFRDSLGGYEDAEAVDLRQTPAISEIERRFQNIVIPVPAGKHKIGASFIARTHAESDRTIDHLSPGETFDNIPIVHSLKTYGPENVTSVPDVPSRQKIFSCYPKNNDEERGCAVQILSDLARLAFRRPVTDADMEPLLNFYDNGHAEGGFETGVQKGIMAILASTKFLYRAEPLPEDAQPGDVFPVTDMELASRLSYFLWGRGPDEELITLAETGKLKNRDVLREQVSRMLADPRAISLTESFAFQWLKVDGVDTIDPDPRLFPEFDDDLRESYKTELAMFTDSILRSDRSVLDLLNADHTYVDERLARQYGIDGVRGTQFQQVTLDNRNRWGLLGKGGLMMLTSYPNRTSPVLRGAYVLETFMGTPPAAPPPGLDIDIETKPGQRVLTLRERMENHREQPSCNNCHGVIDPLGMALENFNVIGQWRDIDRFANAPIDAAGNLANGAPVDGVAALSKALLDNPDQFVQTLTEKLMTYALGRSVQYYDMPLVRRIVDEAADHGNRFDAIIQAIVESDVFMMKSLPLEEEHHDEVVAVNN